jgi:hypothetical protein
MSTTTEPILDSIAAIDSSAQGDKLSYRKATEIFNVDRTTLSRRHHNKQQSVLDAHKEQMLLDPQEEKELVEYIQGLSASGLAPTRSMIKNIASEVSQWEVSRSWVERFLRRNRDQLSPKYTTGIDYNRFKTDTEHSYHTYFDLLYAKMQQYDVDAENVYNMDEKGFLLGKTLRTKRIFSKQLWEQKKVTAALQDSSREWITVLATICADGSWVDPAVIFEAKGALRDAWLRDVDAQKHQVFCTTSASGWSNNEVGLAWLEQVFDRRTKKKAQRKYRILILDGHASHLTRAFIKYCDRNKILLMVFPPHSTHSLQPLDVVMFAPLSSSYSRPYPSQERRLLLTLLGRLHYLVHAQEHTEVFKAGIEPCDADVVLKRFKNTTPQESKDVEIAQLGDGSTWNDLRKLLRVAVTDTSKVEAQALGTAIHSLQVKNELYRHENDGLCTALNTKQRHKGKSKALDLP